MHAYPHVPHGDNHSMFGRCDVDLNSCIPTLGYLLPPAAVRQISAANASHRVIGPLVHHALPWGRMHSFSLCLSYLLLVPRVGGWAPKNFYSRFFPRGERCSSRLERRRKRSLPQHVCWGQASHRRHVLRFHSIHLACCPRRAQIGTWFLGDLMFHCSRPVLPPSAPCAWLAALDVH